MMHPMWKIRWEYERGQEFSQKVILEHEWREDFVGEALTIFLGKDGEFVAMDFYSAEHGCTRWISGRGTYLPQIWCENDTSAGEPISYFRERLLSKTDVKRGNHLILETILRKLPYGPLEKSVRRALLRRPMRVVLPGVFFGGLIGASS